MKHILILFTIIASINLVTFTAAFAAEDTKEKAAESKTESKAESKTENTTKKIAIVAENSIYKKAVIKELFDLSEQSGLGFEYAQFTLNEGANIATQDYDVLVFFIANVNGRLRKQAQNFIAKNSAKLDNVVFYTTYRESNLYRKLPKEIDALASASQKSKKSDYARQIFKLIQQNLGE